MGEVDRSFGDGVAKMARFGDESSADGEISRLLLGVEGTGSTGVRLADKVRLEDAMVSPAELDDLINILITL